MEWGQWGGGGVGGGEGGRDWVLDQGYSQELAASGHQVQKSAEVVVPVLGRLKGWGWLV